MAQQRQQLQQKKQQRPIVDLLVALIAIPLLIICALQLETTMQSGWETNSETRWLVFGLGVCMLLVSLVICGYVTHRLGVCLWTGPLEASTPQPPSNNVISSQNDVLRFIDTLPPSYESVMKFDIPPPAYDCIVINIDDDGTEGKCQLPSSILFKNSNLETPTSSDDTTVHM